MDDARLKELRDKVKAGTISEKERVELMKKTDESVLEMKKLLTESLLKDTKTAG